MALLDLWNSNPDQLADKHVNQLIAFAGAGRLLDESACSAEFRQFLSRVSAKHLQRYADQCLTESFDGSGLALQDIVNEVGVRIGADVTHGRYRGSQKHTGLDGLWSFSNGRKIVIEVKTTDAYAINLNTIAGYRKSLIEKGDITEETSSILLVVGRQETENLEAQIRGSRYAWNIRVISVDALIRLMFIKEEVEDPVIFQKIHALLIPYEFTRIDGIADLLFSAAKEIRQEADIPGGLDDRDNGTTREKDKVPAFHEECVKRAQAHLKVQMVKRTRSGYSTPDNKIGIICCISKEYSADKNPNYWFGFHPHQQEFLKNFSIGYIAFGCGKSSQVLLVPYAELSKWLESSWITTKEDRMYWHVVIYRENKKYELRLRKGEDAVDLTDYLLV